MAYPWQRLKSVLNLMKITRFVGTTRLNNQKGVSIGSAIFEGLVVDGRYHQHRDTQTVLRIFLAIARIRVHCGLKMPPPAAAAVAASSVTTERLLTDANSVVLRRG